eukprot:772869-Ditylum_brightwellii.AAC.2
MRSLHGTTLTSTNRETAAYHKGFNPPEGGEQCSDIYIKKGRKSQSEQGKTNKKGQKKINK